MAGWRDAPTNCMREGAIGIHNCAQTKMAVRDGRHAVVTRILVVFDCIPVRRQFAANVCRASERRRGT
jgi:hypothetical protein